LSGYALTLDGKMQDPHYFAYQHIVSRLNDQGLPTQSYTVPAFTGFGPVTDGLPTNVFCIESLLGPAVDRPGYSTYAVAQNFPDCFPNLALTLVVDLKDAEKQPHPAPTRLNVDLDKKLSTIFLPALYTAFNDLDPAGQNHSILVQSYNSEMTLSDLLLASKYTLDLLLRYKRDGQLAMIAVDYYDPLSTTIAKFMQLGRRIFGGDIHLISRTKVVSAIKIPIASPGGQPYLVESSSTALDQGFALARHYLTKNLSRD
jgi:hypothetical protein